MQYMLMCCIDEALWNGLPDAERDSVMTDYHALIQEMVTSGHYRGGLGCSRWSRPPRCVSRTARR